MTSTEAPATIETARLLLRKPEAGDAEAIFARYASDTAVGRYVSWPLHRTLDDTRAFLEFSDAQWQSAPAGPYLICSKTGETLLGSTGLAFEQPDIASTGYVLARDSWGMGYATEAVVAMRDIAASLRLRRLYALCHPEHQASRRVLEKAGFRLEGTLQQRCEFPNLEPGTVQDVVCYGCVPNKLSSVP